MSEEMEETLARRPPAKVRRQLRTDVCFGCAACGNPLLEYHHIVEFAEENHNRPEDMLAVCPNHHTEITAGAISEKKQREWKSDPFNVRHGYADGSLLTESTYIAVEAATNYLVGLGFHLLVDEAPLLGIRKNSSGHILLSVDLYAEDDSLMVSVIDNEWISGDPTPWDIEYRPNYLTIREKARKISLILDFRGDVISVNGELWRGGQKFGIRGDCLSFNGSRQTVNFSCLGLVGWELAATTDPGTLRIRGRERLGQGGIVSRANPVQRLTESIDLYSELVRKAKVGPNEKCLCRSGKKWKKCCGPLFR